MIRNIAVLALVLVATAAGAQTITNTGPAPIAAIPVATRAPASLVLAEAHDLTPGDLSAYLDGMLPTALKRTGVAGAVVVVVRDGKPIFSKGYGYADVASKKPVDPAATLFRVGSISKLFTWTAVMQLQEQGRLDLDRDINTYLDFTIPPAFGKPVTLKNLMTHTPGFEESIRDLGVYDPARKKTLEAALKAWVPTRIFPPGEVPAYSNYGAALAGYIVQRVSGEPFEQYVDRHIFAPLAMRHATFAQPLPGALTGDMSRGYNVASEDPKRFEIVNVGPAGALSASGNDIARFMMAHLNNGSLDGVQILKPETARFMHGIALQIAPQVPGMAYGFYHEDRNGHVIIGHGGDTQFFHSDLHLILDENIGLFISMNSSGYSDSNQVTGTRKEFFQGFMDRYFPVHEAGTPAAIRGAADDARTTAGLYRVSRRSETNLLRISDLAGQLEVSANKDGTISLPLFLDSTGKPATFRETSRGVWRETGGTHHVVGVMRDGRLAFLMTDEFPQIMVVQPVSRWDSMYWRLPVFGFALAMLLLTVLAWPIKAILRWRYGKPNPLSGRALTLYRLARTAALLDLVFVGCMAGFLVMGMNDLTVLSSANDWLLRLFQMIGLAGVIGTVFVILNFREALGDRARPWWTKATDGLLAFAALAFVLLTFSYHMISLSLNY